MRPSTSNPPTLALSATCAFCGGLHDANDHCCALEDADIFAPCGRCETRSFDAFLTAQREEERDRLAAILLAGATLYAQSVVRR
jgi:hypothetical protein